MHAFLPDEHLLRSFCLSIARYVQSSYRNKIQYGDLGKRSRDPNLVYMTQENWIIIKTYWFSYPGVANKYRNIHTLQIFTNLILSRSFMIKIKASNIGVCASKIKSLIDLVRKDGCNTCWCWWNYIINIYFKKPVSIAEIC